MTRAGLTQAERNATIMVGRGIDVVFTSPLGRAVTTARIFADAVGAPVTIVEELAEIHHGHFAGLTNDQIRAAHPGALEDRATDKYWWRFPGGESYADSDRRAGQALARIAAHRPRCPLIVSHEMIGRMLLRHLLHLSPDDALGLDQRHDVIYQIDADTARLTRLRPEPLEVGARPTPAAHQG